MDLNYSKMAENIIESSVKSHLKYEIKNECEKIAKDRAKIWLKKNKKDLVVAIDKAVGKRLDTEKKGLIEKLAKQVKVKQAGGPRYYY